MTTGDTSEWVACGRRFSAQEIREIRQTVAWLPGLARKELAATVCEHLHWHTAAGTPKIQACQRLLERLAAAGLVELPRLRIEQRHGGPGAAVCPSGRTAPGQPLAGPLRDFQPVRLEPVTGAAETGLWNEYVERFHPLGYRGAFGYRLRYFIHAGRQRLGCVLLGGAAKAIAARDRWIGSNLSHPRGGQAAHRSESAAHQATPPASPSQGVGRLVGLEPTCLSPDRTTHPHRQRPAFFRPTGSYARCSGKQGKVGSSCSTMLLVGTALVAISPPQRLE